MSQRRVSFFSDGLRLDGVLTAPERQAENARLPGVVICHGFTQHKEIFSLDYAAALAPYGYACLSFDYRGFGGSEGPRGRLIPLEQVNDARSAITWLQTQPEEVDPERIGLLGTSFGGAVALHVAAHDPRVKALACFDAIGSGRSWLRGQRRHHEWVDFLKRLERDRRGRVLTGKSEYVDVGEINFYSPQSRAAHEQRQIAYPDWQSRLPLETGDAVLEFNPEDDARRISPRPLLVVYDSNPYGHAGEQALSIYAKAREPKELVATPPSAYQYSHYQGEELQYWIDIVGCWFQGHL